MSFFLLLFCCSSQPGGWGNFTNGNRIQPMIVIKSQSVTRSTGDQDVSNASLIIGCGDREENGEKEGKRWTHPGYRKRSLRSGQRLLTTPIPLPGRSRMTQRLPVTTRNRDACRGRMPVRRRRRTRLATAATPSASSIAPFGY